MMDMAARSNIRLSHAMCAEACYAWRPEEATALRQTIRYPIL